MKNIKTKKKTSPRGGRWRAWIRYKSQGQKGTPNITELARSYHDAVVAECPDLLDLARHGAAATKACRIAVRKIKGSSFGITGRLALSKCRRQVKAAFWHKTCGMSVSDRALAIAEHRGTHGVQGDALQSAMSMARSHQNMDGRNKVRQVEADLKAVEMYESSAGLQSLSKLTELLPWLLPESLKPVPMGKSACFSFKPSGQETATMGCAWAGASRKTNVGPCLEEAWAEQHQTVMHNMCPPVGVAGAMSSVCRDAGICICSVQGRRLYRFRNALLRQMKASFKEPSKRNLLAEGFVVAHLSCISGPMEDGPDSGPGEGGMHDLWLHVGLQYFSPYRPTYHILQKVDSPDHEEQDATPCVYLKANSDVCVVARDVQPNLSYAD